MPRCSGKTTSIGPRAGPACRSVIFRHDCREYGRDRILAACSNDPILPLERCFAISLAERSSNAIVPRAKNVRRTQG